MGSTPTHKPHPDEEADVIAAFEGLEDLLSPEESDAYLRELEGDGRE